MDTSTTPTSNRIERLERALGLPEPKRPLYGAPTTMSRTVVVLVGVSLVAAGLVLIALAPRGLAHVLGDCGFFITGVGMVLEGAGQLIYERKRTLAGLIRITAALVFVPVAVVLFLGYFYFRHGAVEALFFALFLIAGYCASRLWHRRRGDAQ